MFKSSIPYKATAPKCNQNWSKGNVSNFNVFALSLHLAEEALIQREYLHLIFLLRLGIIHEQLLLYAFITEYSFLLLMNLLR